jgi:hypothetical protein
VELHGNLQKTCVVKLQFEAVELVVSAALYCSQELSSSAKTCRHTKPRNQARSTEERKKKNQTIKKNYNAKQKMHLKKRKSTTIEQTKTRNPPPA